MSTDRNATDTQPVKRTGLGFGTWVMIGLLAIAGLWLASVRNDLASARQDVLAQFGQVQNVMQRRTDVLVNVANAAAGAAQNERGALTDIAKARASATNASSLVSNMDLTKLTQDKELQKQFFEAMAAQQQALLKLNSVVEAYPEIKATPLYARLQDEVAGSENRVAVERMRSQQKIRDYNARVVMFPGNIVAGVFGYPEMAYYEAEKDAQHAPDLSKVLAPGKP